MASLYAFSFIREDYQEINYTQVFFSWSQISDVDQNTDILDIILLVNIILIDNN